MPNTHGSQRYSTGLWEKKEVYCEVDQQGDRRQGSNPPQSGVQSHFSELEEEEELRCGGAGGQALARGPWNLAFYGKAARGASASRFSGQRTLCF